MTKWKDKLHEVIFEAETRAGKSFDIWLLIFIFLSLIVVMLDSVESIQLIYAKELIIAEWFFTILFTVEFILRLISVNKPFKYVFSFYGIIDLISTIPTYLVVFFPGASLFKVLRVLRFLRLFKIFKLGRFTSESKMLGKALKDSQAKIIVFLVAVFCLAMIMGSIMYVVEGQENGFTSIPRSIYWAIVTLTTVGYGDISPVTPFGQVIASIIMILGYGIIAVPTGIVTAGVILNENDHSSTQTCKNCSLDGHEEDAVFCKFCGEKM